MYNEKAGKLEFYKLVFMSGLIFNKSIHISVSCSILNE